MEPDSFSLQSATDEFLINYKSRSDAMYNSDNVLEGRIKKSYDFTGRSKNVETHLSYSGSVGSGSLPVAGTARYKQAVVTAKKVYARAQIDREAIAASANDKGAFRRATQETTRKTVESYMRNCSRILFGDGTGILAKGDGAGTVVSGNGSTATPYLVEIPDAQWLEAKWEEEDLVQVVTGLDAKNEGGAQEGGLTTTNLLKVENVDVDNKVISLVGTSPALSALVGSSIPATTGFCMQRSYLDKNGEKAEPMGLKGALTPYAGVSSLYGIPLQRRWSAFAEDAAGVGITVDLMNKVMLKVQKKFGQVPNLIMTGFEQFQNFLALLEDQKYYEMGNRNLVKGQEVKGKFSFSGVQFMSVRGAVGVFTDRFCEEDRIYFINENYIERLHRPKFGWFTDDGTVFMRVGNEDEYEARYGGYFENFITPTAHGVLHGLAV